jgi:hypothetical protein
MTAVKLDELENAALAVDDGEGSTKALVSRETGMIHLLNDEYMDEEAPLPSDQGGNGDRSDDGGYVSVPAAGALGLGDALVLRFAGSHLAGDEAAVRDLMRYQDNDGFARLLEERGAAERWQRFRTEETRAALGRWCQEHGLELAD